MRRREATPWALYIPVALFVAAWAGEVLHERLHG